MNFNQNAAEEGAGGWSSFKARWVQIILKMGQEEEVEKKRGGGGGGKDPRLSRAPLPASCVYLSRGRGLML